MNTDTLIEVITAKNIILKKTRKEYNTLLRRCSTKKNKLDALQKEFDETLINSLTHVALFLKKKNDLIIKRENRLMEELSVREERLDQQYRDLNQSHASNDNDEDYLNDDEVYLKYWRKHSGGRVVKRKDIVNIEVYDNWRGNSRECKNYLKKNGCTNDNYCNFIHYNKK